MSLPIFTRVQYESAVRALRLGSEQLEPDGKCCAICGDTGHQAWECGHNPLYAMATCVAMAATAQQMHDTLYLLAGLDTYMGETIGPAKVVLPDRK